MNTEIKKVKDDKTLLVFMQGFNNLLLSMMNANLLSKLEINYLEGHIDAAYKKENCTGFSGPCMGAFE